MHVLMLFLDGVGLGNQDAEINPFFAARLPAFRSLFHGELPSLRHQHLSNTIATVVPLDPNLGVEGLPQSGTGQTALFTGVNGAKIIGKHFGPHPYSTLRPIIEQKNIFKRLLDAGKSVYFANAYPQRFFDYLEKRRTRLSVTTLSCIMSGVRLLRVEDLASARGISADITNEGWPKLGYPDIQSIAPSEAGHRLARLSGEHDFVLFEYWKTDHAGHSLSVDEAVAALELLDGMLGGILDHMDMTNTLLFITSDHGNIEDMTVKVHTRNPVPAILCGHRHREMGRFLHSSSGHTKSLTYVTPLLLDVLTAR